MNGFDAAQTAYDNDTPGHLEPGPHEVQVDESQDADGGTMFKAFCNTCNWSGERWHHSDEYADRDDEHPDDLAHAAAQAEADEHAKLDCERCGNQAVCPDCVGR